MARDKGDDAGKRRWGRGGKPEEGPSDEELGWLADLRGGPGDQPLGDEPRSRRAGRGEEPPSAGLGARPVRRTPPLPVSPAGPTSPPAPPPPSERPPVDPRPPSRGFLRRTPAAPPPPPPPVTPPPFRAGGARPALDWSDQTDQIAAVPDPYPGGEPPRGRGRGADARGGEPRGGGRTGALRAPTPAGPPVPPVPPAAAPPPVPAPPPALPAPGALAPVGRPRPAPPVPAPAPVPLPVPLPAPMPGPLPGAAPDSMTTGMIRRAELRRHLKIQQQLKGITLVLVVMLLLAAYPIYLFAQTFAADPVFVELDGLSLPTWAAYKHEDRADGSRWCIRGCRERTRVWYSQEAPDETQTAYATALLGDGWRPRDGCPVVSDQDSTSLISCWKKDEYKLDMLVQESLCETPPSREPLPGTTAAPGPEAGEPVCAKATVTMFIANVIDEQS